MDVWVKLRFTEIRVLERRLGICGGFWLINILMRNNRIFVYVRILRFFWKVVDGFRVRSVLGLGRVVSFVVIVRLAWLWDHRGRVAVSVRLVRFIRFWNRVGRFNHLWFVDFWYHISWLLVLGHVD